MFQRRGEAVSSLKIRLHEYFTLRIPALHERRFPESKKLLDHVILQDL